METLLLVDDNKNMRLKLRKNLQQHDYAVVEASHGKRLFEIISRHNIDLILLNVCLPDGNSFDFLSDIRMRTNAPVILMSADKDKKSALKGFEAGADDYLSKPFDPEILVAKVKALLLRYNNAIAITKNDNEDVALICFHGWVFDRSQFQIFDKNNKSGNLTSIEFELLDVLIQCAGRAVKRDELCEAVRKDNYVPTPRAIDVKITRIRKKIGDDGHNPQFINTIRGVGYMFNHNKITPSI